MTQPWRISRRTVLRGLGTAVALPWLEAMAPAAALAGAARTSRLATQADGLPLRPQRRPHAGLDAGAGRDGLRAARPSSNRLTPFKDDLLVLTGLTQDNGRRPRRRRRRPRPRARAAS